MQAQLRADQWMSNVNVWMNQDLATFVLWTSKLHIIKFSGSSIGKFCSVLVFRANMLSAIQAVYKDCSLSLRINGFHGNMYSPVGSRQGCPLSATLLGQISQDKLPWRSEGGPDGAGYLSVRASRIYEDEVPRSLRRSSWAQPSWRLSLSRRGGGGGGRFTSD